MLLLENQGGKPPSFAVDEKDAGPKRGSVATGLNNPIDNVLTANFFDVTEDVSLFLL